MDGLTYREQTRYDALGRAWKMRDASGHWVIARREGRCPPPAPLPPQSTQGEALHVMPDAA